MRFSGSAKRWKRCLCCCMASNCFFSKHCWKPRGLSTSQHWHGLSASHLLAGWKAENCLLAGEASLLSAWLGLTSFSLVIEWGESISTAFKRSPWQLLSTDLRITGSKYGNILTNTSAGSLFPSGEKKTVGAAGTGIKLDCVISSLSGELLLEWLSCQLWLSNKLWLFSRRASKASLVFMPALVGSSIPTNKIKLNEMTQTCNIHNKIVNRKEQEENAKGWNYVPSERRLLIKFCLSSSDARTKLATLTCSFESLFISSCACCLLSATCAAITFCRSAIKMHLLQRQFLHWQARLWPFSHDTMPWFLHLAHFGALGGLVSGDSNEGGESGKCMKLGPSISQRITNLWRQKKMADLSSYTPLWVSVHLVCSKQSFYRSVKSSKKWLQR